MLLRAHSGVDFSLYKSTTIRRRIARRVVLGQHNGHADYAKFLRGNSEELDTLFSDTLISVTSFFRNPEAFDVLQRVVFPKIVKQRRDDSVRVWVLGCSTGQEAYSIGMAYTEFVDKVTRAPKLQIFATDLNNALLEKARAGLYAKSLAADISPERLRRFFVEEEGGYRVVKSLREAVVFARQNLISDPPFSRMDLICCRNLLIYLEPALQKKSLTGFHYALRPEGFLFLGASESIGQFTALFEPVDKKHKVFAKKPVETPAHHLPWLSSAPAEKKRGPVASRSALPEGLRVELSAQREADRLIVNEFAPPGVLINADLQIVQFRGPTGAYFGPPRGNASFDVLKMAREGLMLPLRAAINKAKKEKKAVSKKNVRLHQDGHARAVDIQVIPLTNLKERTYLILFQEASPFAAEPVETTGHRPGRGTPALRGAKGVSAPLSGTGRGDGERPGVRALRQRIAESERELAEMRDYLQSVQEQYDAANEELQASNEEGQSANEELQSINEELETSKEELESTNEELTTVNEEMANRNAELSRLNSDLNNLHGSIHTAILVLGRDLTIRRFTPLAERAFNLLATDVGRPLSGIRHNLFAVSGAAPNAGEALALPLDLEDLIREVIDTVSVREREVKDKQGHWYSLRVRPYMTLDNKIDGAVLALVDIDALKRGEFEAKRAGERFRLLATTVPQKIFTAVPGGEVDYFNPQWAEYTGLSFEQIRDWGWTQFIHPDDVAENVRVWKHSIATGEPFHFEHRFRRFDGQYRWHISRAVAFKDDRGRVLMWVGANSDVHDVKQADQRKDEFLALLAHELRNPLAPIQSALQVLRLTGGAGEKSRSSLDIMQRQVGQMARLVDDLLDVSRISQGKITLRRERIELSSVLRQAVEAAQPHYERMEQELAVSLPPRPIYLNADTARMAQIVGNLLNNACKFSKRGGRIGVTVEQDDAHAVIRVEDSGIGIAADQLARIFEMFVQVDSSIERAQGGLGIGLTLAKNLVEMHGGTIEAHSDGPARGSEFVVRLPISTAPLPALQEPPREKPAAAVARRVLVVDDNLDSVNSLAMLLTLDGHEVHTAHDGIGAVEAASALRPQVILLDIGLPGINGYEAARRIRQQQDGNKSLVLIALTGWGQEEDKRRSLEAGFDFHLLKPVDPAALESLLASLPVQ